MLHRPAFRMHCNHLARKQVPVEVYVRLDDQYPPRGSRSSDTRVVFLKLRALRLFNVLATSVSPIVCRSGRRRRSMCKSDNGENGSAVDFAVTPFTPPMLTSFQGPILSLRLLGLYVPQCKCCTYLHRRADIYTVGATSCKMFCSRHIHCSSSVQAHQASDAYFISTDLPAIQSWAGDEAFRIVTGVNRPHKSLLAPHNTLARKAATMLP